MTQQFQNIAASNLFQRFFAGVIPLAGALVGLETRPALTDEATFNHATHE